MPAPVLATKLYVPSPRPKVVLRPRLIERLNEGLQRTPGVILISAAAGFGKTTLVSEWIATLTSGVRVAWLSLDEGDNDPARFLAYLIAAVQTIAPKIGEATLSALQSSQPQPTEVLLTALLNDLTTVGDVVLVLDDYHAIESPPIDEALLFFVEHLPPQLHLVIATREDPSLPLARLRVRGQLTELRAADLRFRPAEAAEFLNRAMGLNLSAVDIAALENRTEGWIAGLQLAALALQGRISMQGHQDAAGFIKTFTGSHRFVLDYLIEEVLQRQPEHVRSFLLQTSILDRLSGPLCDAVLGKAEGRRMMDEENRSSFTPTPRPQGEQAASVLHPSSLILEYLERANLFIVPLDNERRWYRYHHLFAEVLQAHLREAQPDRVSEFHRRASVWYEQHDLPAEAIRHALSAQDFERAATLIERVWLVMDLNYQSAMWLSWVKALPDDVIRARPVVSAGYAWALLNGGELEASEARLRDAERWLEPSDELAAQTCPERSRRMVVVDEVEFRSLPASIASARAYRALALGDISGTKVYARQTLARVPEDDLIRRTQATALLGMAEYASGDLPAAERFLLDFQTMMWQAGDLANAISITFILANIKLAQGRLREAVSAYQQSLQLATSRGASFLIGVSDLHRGLSELLCEQGDREAATQHLLTAQKLGERGALTGWPHRVAAAQARLTAAQGDLASALVLLNEAERQYVRNPLPDWPIAAMRARVWVRQGKLTEAERWVHEQGLSSDDDLSYLREFEHLTLARVLIARDKTDRVDDTLRTALELLKRLLQAAEEGGRTGSVIEILTLQALAHQAQGDLPRALASLERALTLAEPEGYIQIFADEGAPMAELLGRMNASIEVGKRQTYVHQLLAAFGVEEIHPSALSLQPLIEPLSERELEVLRLLGTELSGPEIARKLSVSLNTVRTHTKNIYSKLGANNRRAAIRRAEELGLL